MHDGRQSARSVLRVRDVPSPVRGIVDDDGDALRPSGMPGDSAGLLEPTGLDDVTRSAPVPDALEAVGVAPKKRRKKGTSPSARTLAECRKRGWIAQVVERFNTYTNQRVDLFGVIDLVAISPTGIVGIQACAGSRSDGRGGGDHAARRAKILAEPRARAWVQAGAALQVWSWAKRGEHGSRKLWTLRVEEIRVEDFAADVARETEVVS